MKWPNLIAVTGLGLHILRDDKFSVPEEFVDNFPRPSYGLTWGKKHIVLSEMGNLHFFTKDGYVCRPSQRPKDGYHQILIWNERLYATITAHDFIDEIDLETKELTNSVDLKPGYTRNKDGSDDWSHVNSICCDGKNFYVVHHNYRESSYISVLDMNLKKEREIENIGAQNHNVYVTGNKLYTLSSLMSEIVMINLKTEKQKKWKVPSPTGQITYLRGLAKSKDHFVIGVTHSHGRDERDKEQSYLLLYDNKMNYLDKKQLPQTGQIREVRVIDEPDFAHNDVASSI